MLVCGRVGKEHEYQENEETGKKELGRISPESCCSNLKYRSDRFLTHRARLRGFIAPG
jgi:hypothetical protein